MITFLFTLLSGALRKWFIEDGIFNNIILFLQLIIPFIFVFLMPRKKWDKNLFLLAALYSTALIIFAYNPLNQSISHGVLGIILHLGLWLSLFYYLSIRTQILITPKVFFIFIILCFIQITFSIIQYNLPQAHILNKYVVETKYIAKVGDAVRVTGTFSYIAGFNAFLVFLGALIWSLAVQKKYQPLNIILLTLLPLATMISGSRASLFLSGFFLLIIIWELSKKSFKTLSALGAVGIVIFGLNLGNISNTLIKSYENIYERIESNITQGEQEARILGPIQEVIEFKGKNPVTGIGLGATYQGANAIFGSNYLLETYGGFEQEFKRIVIEGGFILLFIKLFLWITLIAYTKIPKFFIIPWIIIFMIYFPTVFNTYNSYFFLIGFILVDYSYLKKV